MRTITITAKMSTPFIQNKFRNVLKSRVAQLMGVDYKFDVMMSEDGSGRGAALVAAVLQGEEQL